MLVFNFLLKVFFSIVFAKSILTAPKPINKAQLNMAIIIPQLTKVKKVPKIGSNNFSSIIPNMQVGNIVAITLRRYDRYCGFSLQFLFNRRKFRMLVRT